MRVLVIAAAAIALTTAPAAAQGMGKPQPDQKTDPNKEAKRKADEKAYHDALSKIPNAKEPLDPWKNQR